MLCYLCILSLFLTWSLIEKKKHVLQFVHSSLHRKLMCYFTHVLYTLYIPIPPRIFPRKILSATNPGSSPRKNQQKMLCDSPTKQDMVRFETSWNIWSMEFYEILWESMRFYEILWVYEILWDSKRFYEILIITRLSPWNSMRFYEITMRSPCFSPGSPSWSQWRRLVCLGAHGLQVPRRVGSWGVPHVHITIRYTYQYIYIYCIYLL